MTIEYTAEQIGEELQQAIESGELTAEYANQLVAWDKECFDDETAEDVIIDDTDTLLSERTDNRAENKVTIDLLGDHRRSDHEKNVNHRIAITESWQRVEKLMASETTNAWALGDEFKWLAEQRLTVREIADRVGRGKSYVDSLIATAKWVKPESRNYNHTWFAHDLMRRAADKFSEMKRNGKVASSTPFINGADGLTAIKVSGARTTKDAVNAIASTLANQGKLTDGEKKSLTAKTDPYAGKHVIDIHLTANDNERNGYDFNVKHNGENFYQLTSDATNSTKKKWFHNACEGLREILAQFEKHLPAPEDRIESLSRKPENMFWYRTALPDDTARERFDKLLDKANTKQIKFGLRDGNHLEPYWDISDTHFQGIGNPKSDEACKLREYIREYLVDGSGYPDVIVQQSLEMTGSEDDE